MAESKKIRILITEGDDEEVLAVKVIERHPNQIRRGNTTCHG